MSTALVIVTDGRGEYLEQTVKSFRQMCAYQFDLTVLVDDSADPEFNAWARELTGADRTVLHERRMGGAAAVQSAWKTLHRAAADGFSTDYVFHLEDDWTFPESVPVNEMIDVLESDPWLANVVLRRQHWGTEPIGGYIAADGAAFLPRQLGTIEYLEHRKGFWLNPSVYPYRITFTEWPKHGHEHHHSEKLLRMGFKFAVYGGRWDSPRCRHIGVQRSNAWTW